MRKKIIIKLATVVLSFCVLLLSGHVLHAATAMPHFSLPDADSGKMVDSNEFEGKAKLVVFFATWCPPCMEEVPTLKELQEEYGHDDFAIIALSIDQRTSAVQRFIQMNNINYTVLMSDRVVERDFGGIPGVPVTFLISKEGNVLRKYPGLVPHKLLERGVKGMLAD